MCPLVVMTSCTLTPHPFHGILVCLLIDVPKSWAPKSFSHVSTNATFFNTCVTSAEPLQLPKWWAFWRDVSRNGSRDCVSCGVMQPPHSPHRTAQYTKAASTYQTVARRCYSRRNSHVLLRIHHTIPRGRCRTISAFGNDLHGCRARVQSHRLLKFYY